MSLLFKMLSRLVITFLPRSKRLLISWLQSPSAVILEPPPQNSLSLFPLFPYLFAMKWWDRMPWSSFFDCWVLSQLFYSPLSLSSRGSLALFAFSYCSWGSQGRNTDDFTSCNNLCAATSFSAQSLSRVWLFATLWTVAHQVPLSMGFPRQESWSGLPFPSPGYLPDLGTEPRSPTSPALQVDSLCWATREAWLTYFCHCMVKETEVWRGFIIFPSAQYVGTIISGLEF